MAANIGGNSVLPGLKSIGKGLKSIGNTGLSRKKGWLRVSAGYQALDRADNSDTPPLYDYIIKV